MRVAILGLGEAGEKYSRAFASAGQEVVGFDPRDVEVGAGVTKASSVQEAVQGAELVLGLTTAKPSVAVAAEAADALTAGAVYIDLNAAAPERKQEVAAALGETAKMVDGAVIGSVQKFGAQVHVLLSGPHAEEAAALLSVIDAKAEAIGGGVGDASRRKLLRSVFMKGLGALISEAMEAGESANEAEWMRAQISGELAQGEATLDRLWAGTKTHAYRRGMELGDSLNVLDTFGGTWPVTRGARSVHLDLARKTGADEKGVVDALASIPTSALGDGGDRLGMLHSRIKPVWDCPPLAGRAFTVTTRPGDNQALHQSLKLARPGDVLVIDGGGHAERALMGELIAERAQIAGIAGMIIDGAVRDVKELAALGFPVWAAGVTPAGPYKSGPGRCGQSVSIGGVVCHPGDIVVADADGVIVVPALEAESVLAAGQVVVADEQQRQRDMRDAAKKP